MSSRFRKLVAAAEAGILHDSFIPFVYIAATALPLAFFGLFPVQPSSDAAWYAARATELAAGSGYQEGGYPTAYWPIGWPALLAIGVLFTQSVVSATLLINIGAAILTIYCVLRIARRLTGEEKTARLAAAMMALYPGAIALATQSLTEISYTAIMLLAFVLLIEAGGRTIYLVVAGLIYGAATLIKPQTLLFPFGAIIALMLVYKGYKLGAAAKSAILVYAALAVVVLPWSARNLAVFGEFVLVSTNAGTALLIGANDRAHGEHMDPRLTGFFDSSEIAWEDRVKRQVELNHAQKAAATKWIQENPKQYLALMPTKLGLLWRKDTYAFWGALKDHPDKWLALRTLQAVNQLFYLCVLCLSLVTAFVCLFALVRRDQRLMPLALLFCMPVFVSLLAMVFTGQVRYHYPAMPYLIIAAAWAFWAGVERLSKSHTLPIQVRTTLS